jgi:membrane-bound lytic murein transglycosylase MltF
VFVQRATSYYESLTALNVALRGRGKAPVRLREAPAHFETEDMLEMANAGLVGTVIADDYLAHFWKQVYPQLTLHEDLAVRQDGAIAFAVRKDSPKLKAALDAFTEQHRAGTLFGNVELRKYLAQTRWARNALEQADRERFDQMVTLFRKYGAQYNVDWLLMAAQGYQESQLDQSRHSSAGAVGVMQLTSATGKQMNVGDVTRLEPNINAGIKYVRYLADRYYSDPGVDPLNRVLFAFAAYNAGPARIRSARKAAAEAHLDPNVWFDNVERAVSAQVGRETVQYVSNIYKYFIAYSLVEDDVAKDVEKSTKQ